MLKPFNEKNNFLSAQDGLDMIKTALSAGYDEGDLDLIELDVAVAISTGNKDEYKILQNRIKEILEHIKDKPEGLLMIVSQNFK